MTPLNIRRQKSHFAIMEVVEFGQYVPIGNLAVRLKLLPVVEISWEIRLFLIFQSFELFA